MLLHEAVSEMVIGAAIEVHRELGPGLLESAYEACLVDELSAMGVRYQSQVDLPISYKGRLLACGYRMDLVIEDTIVVEIKAVDKLQPIHTAQMLTYLKLAKKPVGLLMNFNVPVLKDGIVRKVL